MASEAAAYAATFNPMGLSAETRRWTDLDNNRTIYDANGNIQYNEVAAGSANFGQAGATPTPDPDLKRGYNWEYLGVGAARADAEGVDYRRLLSPEIRQPAHQRQPQPEPDRIGRRSPSSDRQTTCSRPAAARRSRCTPSIRPQAGRATLSPRSRLPIPTSTTASNSAGTRGSARGSSSPASRPSGAKRSGATAAPAPRTNPRDNPNGLRFCDNVPPFRTTFKGSASYTMPWDIQVSGSFSAVPGTSVAANYTVNSTIAGRPIVGANLERHDDQRQPGRAEHAVPRLPKPARWTRRQDLPLRPLPGAGLRGHLQRAERRDDHERQPDLRRHRGIPRRRSSPAARSGSARSGSSENRVIE